MRRTHPIFRIVSHGFVFLIACVSFLGRQSPCAAAEPRRPNFVFILADDLGYGDLGCYGQKMMQTPNLDRLAVEGMRFTDFYAGSTVCAPSRCVLMTGLHTGHCYIRGNGRVNLRPEDLTFAELLQTAGYATGLVGKWGLGHEGSTGLPTRQGFDEFFGYLDQMHAHNYYPSFLVRDQQRVALRNVVDQEGPAGEGVATHKVEYSHDLLTREALQFLERHQDGPFFLYLAYTIPHANNEAGNLGMEVPDHGLYAHRDWPQAQKGLAAMISRLDRDVGTLVHRLGELGLDESTVVIFTSDNGPHREGGNDPDFFDSNGPLRGIKRDLYEGGIRMPMIVRWTGKIQPGSSSRHIGHFADVLPTIADLAGAKAPSNIDGISFAPELFGDKQRAHDYLYWEFYEGGFSQAVRQGRWKAVRKRTAQEVFELYDLQADLGETRDLSVQHPERVTKFRRIMDQAHVPSPIWKAP